MNWLRKPGPRWLLVSVVVSAAGCGDSSASILRTGANLRSELTDRAMQVNDEAAAKKFMDHYLRAYTDRIKDVDEKWQKWIKDIEDEFRKDRVRVVAFKTTAKPGEDQWLKDAELNVPSPKAAEAKPDYVQRLAQTREDFMQYMTKIMADRERFNREVDRIGLLIKQRVADKTNEEIAKGVEAPKVSIKDFSPNLFKMTDPNNFKGLLLTGAAKPGQ